MENIFKYIDQALESIRNINFDGHIQALYGDEILFQVLPIGFTHFEDDIVVAHEFCLDIVDKKVFQIDESLSKYLRDQNFYKYEEVGFLVYQLPLKIGDEAIEIENIIKLFFEVEIQSVVFKIKLPLKFKK